MTDAAGSRGPHYAVHLAPGGSVVQAAIQGYVECAFAPHDGGSLYGGRTAG